MAEVAMVAMRRPTGCLPVAVASAGGVVGTSMDGIGASVVGGSVDGSGIASAMGGSAVGGSAVGGSARGSSARGGSAAAEAPASQGEGDVGWRGALVAAAGAGRPAGVGLVVWAPLCQIRARITWVVS